MTAIGLLVLFLIIGLLAYRVVSSFAWLVLIPLTLATLLTVGLLPLGLCILFFSLYSLGLFFYLVPSFRLKWIAAPLFRQFRRVMPVMSKTEQEALQAGTVWWDGELFSGQPAWKQLLEHPPSSLSGREQAFIKGPVEELCKRLDDWQISHQEQDLPEEIWRFIKQSGMFGMIIPKTWGGLGFSAAAHSSIVMKIASRSITAAVTVMVPNSLGPAKLLLHYGTEQQKRQYLQRLALGHEIPCFALTGPQAGSDAGAMPDRGDICCETFEGKLTLGIRLNWNKRYITLAPVATLIGLAFKLYDPEQLLGRQMSLGITVALIPQ